VTTIGQRPNEAGNNRKEPIGRKRFGVLVRFVFSGMNRAGARLRAIQKPLGSRAGAFTIAFPAGWVVHEAQKTACYFIPSAMTGFTASAFLSRNLVSPKAAFEGLDLCGRKLSCTVLRGLEGSNPVRLLGHPANMQGTDLTSVGLHCPIVDPHKAETVFQTRSFVPVVCSIGQMKTNLG